MALRRKQLAFAFRRWGGARAGAGRRPKGASSGVSHLRRPAHSRHHPVHVTLKIVRGVPSLRGRGIFGRVQAALALARERFGFRLVHFSVQRNHVHLIAEAADRRALSRGVQGLTIRVARAVNARLDRAGRLFAERYHARALKTPRACSLAVRYVLLNVRKHADRAGALKMPRAWGGGVREHVGAPGAPHVGFVDPCSSAPWFARFARPRELVFGAAQYRAKFLRATGLASPVVEPRVWLLRAGLKRTEPFDVDDVPASP
jgi:putative transposase